MEHHKSMYGDYNRIIKVYESITGFHLCVVELNNSASNMELHDFFVWSTIINSSIAIINFGAPESM